MNRCCIIFGLSLLTAAGCSVAPTPAPIVVGHVADQSRPDKAGEQSELGIRLALHELTKDTKFTEALGGRPIQVRHTNARSTAAAPAAEPTRTDGNKSASAPQPRTGLEAFEAEAVRLVNINKAVAILGGLNAKQTAALDKAQVPLLTYHGDHGAGASRYVFWLGMSPAEKGKALAEFLSDDAKVQSVVLIGDDRRADYLDTLDVLRATWGSKHKESVYHTLRFGADPKWTSLNGQIAAAKPDVIVFAGAPADFNAWMKQQRQTSAPSSPLLVFAGDDGEHRGLEMGSLKTAVVLATAFMPTGNERTKAFAKAFHEAFQREPDIHAALGYDGFRLLADAIQRAEPLPSPERIRDELQKATEFQGATGLLKLADRQVQRPIFVARWQGGSLTHLRTIALPDKKD